MKILHCITSVNPVGGGPIEGVKQLAHVLTQKGHLVEIVSLDAPDALWVRECSLKTHARGPGKLTYGYSRRLVPWLRAQARSYDVVIVNGLWQYSSFGVWTALHRSQTPYFVYCHGMLDPWFKQTYPLKHLKKSLYWPWGEYRVLRDARAVCFTCEEERLLARQSFARYRCNETVVNYGTAAPSGDPLLLREEFFTCYPELRSKRLLLFLSRIHVKKGCDLLIEAFAKVADSDPSLHLVMAGPDQTGWRAELERQAKRAGIAGRITWTGMLSGDIKWGAFHAADAFVLPSHQENFGIVVAEAMSCGLPVLITNKVNIWREIEGDGAGLVAEDNEEGITQLLRRWLTLSNDEKQSMRRKARQCFAERFEIHQAANSLITVLEANGVKAG